MKLVKYIQTLRLSLVLCLLVGYGTAQAQTTNTVPDSVDTPTNYYKNTLPRSIIPTDEATVLEGKKLFSGQCSKCHELDRQNVGPALASVTDRRPVSWLLAWIEDSQTVIQEGDEYGQYLYQSYDNYVMPPFDFLSREDKLSILAYIQNESGAPTHVSGTSSGSGSGSN